MRMLKAALIVGLTLASGMAAAQTFAPPSGPPAGYAEPPPPGPPDRFVLAPGYYNWVGGSYVWVGPQWMPRRAGFHWVPAHWGPGRFGRWRFFGGHWLR
jgi:hypothetical protein